MERRRLCGDIDAAARHSPGRVLSPSPGGDRGGRGIVRLLPYDLRDFLGRLTLAGSNAMPMSLSPRQMTRHFRRPWPGMSIANRSGTSFLTRKMSLAPVSEIPIMVHAMLRNCLPRTTRALDRVGAFLRPSAVMPACPVWPKSFAVSRSLRDFAGHALSAAKGVAT